MDRTGLRASGLAGSSSSTRFSQSNTLPCAAMRTRNVCLSVSQFVDQFAEPVNTEVRMTFDKSGDFKGLPVDLEVDVLWKW